MNFGRMSTGGVAGFLASSISGPLYALTAFVAPGASEIFDLDLDLSPALIVGLPISLLFGVVLAGLPCILLGMAVSASIGDQPIRPSTVVFAMAIGAIGGAVLLRSLADGDLTAGVAMRGAVIGAVTAFVWTRVFDFLRSRKPTLIVED